MKKLFLPIFFLGISLALPAQGNSDSLWSLWIDSRQADTVRLTAIQHLAWDLLYENPDSTYALAQQELAFAQKINNRKWQAKALNIIASTYNLRGNYAAALKTYLSALDAMTASGDKRGVAAISNNIGLVYRNLGNSMQALRFYQKDLAIQEELSDKTGIANAYNNLGTIYNDQAMLPQALEYYQKSLRLAETLGQSPAIALGYNNIGSIFYEQGKYQQSLEYYFKALAIRKKLNDQRGIAVVYNNIGVNYKEQGNAALAMEYYQKSLQIQEHLDDKPGLASTCYSIGATFLDQRAFSEAARWCEKARELSRQIGSLRAERSSCSCLYKTYKAMGKHDRALAFHEKYVALNDSLQKKETGKQLEQIAFDKQMLTDSLRREEEKLRLEVAYQQEVRKKNRMMNILLITGVFVLALALGFWSRMLYFRKYSEVFRHKAEYLEKQQLINEIALLKTQVNPHFLFNSLSILASLVRVNPDLSEQFIDRLARSYRYILEQKEQSLVSLRTELEFIQSYAFLLKIRFENKFDLHLALPDAALDQFKIAPLTLQLLIENAVKHNRMSVREPLVVDVSIDADPYLIVKNRLQPRASVPASTKLGLQNIINRYILLTERPVWAGEQQEFFVVKIPLLH